jgi:hypothetical protein
VCSIDADSTGLGPGRLSSITPRGGTVKDLQSFGYVVSGDGGTAANLRKRVSRAGLLPSALQSLLGDGDDHLQVRNGVLLVCASIA